MNAEKPTALAVLEELQTVPELVPVGVNRTGLYFSPLVLTILANDQNRAPSILHKLATATPKVKQIPDLPASNCDAAVKHSAQH